QRHRRADDEPFDLPGPYRPSSRDSPSVEPDQDTGREPRRPPCGRHRDAPARAEGHDPGAHEGHFASAMRGGPPLPARPRLVSRITARYDRSSLSRAQVAPELELVGEEVDLLVAIAG